MQFSNFAISATPTSIAGNAITPDNVAFTPTAADIFVSTAPLVGIRIGSPIVRGTNTSDCDSNTGPQDVGLNAWCLSGKTQALSESITYDVTALGGPLTQIGLSGTVVSHANTTTAAVFREICVNATQATAGWSATGGCSGGTYFALQVGSIQGNFTTLSQSVAANFLGATNIAIRDTVFLETFNGSGSFAQLLPYDFTTVTPEPATVSLVGGAMAGLLWFRRRRKA